LSVNNYSVSISKPREKLDGCVIKIENYKSFVSDIETGKRNYRAKLAIPFLEEPGRKSGPVQTALIKDGNGKKMVMDKLNGQNSMESKFSKRYVQKNTY
jgi:hypothetical protein